MIHTGTAPSLPGLGYQPAPACLALLACPQLLAEMYHSQEDFGLSDAQLDKFSDTLLAGGIVPLLVGILTRSRCGPVLRSALSLSCVLMVKRPWFTFG